MSADHLPTFWGPGDFLAHLLLWAGASGGIVAVFVWVLGLYQGAKGWATVGAKTVKAARDGWVNVSRITSERQRAAVWMGICSVFAVGFAYMLAVIMNALVQVAEIDGVNALFSSKSVEHGVVVRLWPAVAFYTVFIGVFGIFLLGCTSIANVTGLRNFVSFLGFLVCAVAWLAGVAGLLDAGVGFVGDLAGGNPAIVGDPAPMSLVVTELIVAVLCLAEGWLLMRIYKANRVAFEGITGL